MFVGVPKMLFPKVPVMYKLLKEGGTRNPPPGTAPAGTAWTVASGSHANSASVNSLT